jgi:hypothetical protein
MNAYTVLEVRPEGILVRVDDGEPATVAVADFDDIDTLAEALSSTFDRASVDVGQGVEVLLRPPLVQVRTLRAVPPVRGRHLAALVGNQLTRFFRPVKGPTVVSAEWVTSDDEAFVRAALAPLDLLERIESAVERSGRRSHGFIPLGGTGSGPRLVTPRARATARRRAALSIGAAATLAAGGWLAAVGAYLLDLNADARAIAGDLAALDEPLRRIDALTEQLTAYAPVAAAVSHRSADASWLLGALGRVATALPPDTYLHAFSAERDGAAILDADGPDPLRVVSLLDAAWPGRVRLEGVPRPGAVAEDGSTSQRFTVAMEPAVP